MASLRQVSMIGSEATLVLFERARFSVLWFLMA